MTVKQQAQAMYQRVARMSSTDTMSPCVYDFLQKHMDDHWYQIFITKNDVLEILQEIIDNNPDNEED